MLSILDDKDAAGMLRALLPRLSAAVFTRAPNPRALPPATLADLASKVGGIKSEIEPDPRKALRRARELAGENGTVLATGSIYLVAELLKCSGRAESERALNEGPSVIAMIALVAFVVALVILVFFGIGYAFGRAFL